MITISPVNFNRYKINPKTRNATAVSCKGLFGPKPDYTEPFSIHAVPARDVLLTKPFDYENSEIMAVFNSLKPTLLATTVTKENPVCYWNSNEPVKKKNIGKIKSEAPKNMKDVVDSLTRYSYEEMIIKCGIKDLRKFVQKGTTTKENAINLLLDVMNCDEIRQAPGHKAIFYGFENMMREFPGYIGLYKELTEK